MELQAKTKTVTKEVVTIVTSQVSDGVTIHLSDDEARMLLGIVGCLGHPGLTNGLVDNLYSKLYSLYGTDEGRPMFHSVTLRRSFS